MIITGSEILTNIQSKDIIVSPFSAENISTNSYDLSLGDRYIRYTEPILDPFKDNAFEENIIPDEGLLLNKGDFILAESLETIGSNKFVPMVHGKSGIARKGLFIHITADLVNLGYIGKITLQLYATQSIVIYKRMKIAQISFWLAKGEVKLYDGKYQNSEGPQTSKIYLDK